MLPATKRREVFLIWGCTDSPPNLKADEKVRVDLDADGIETIEALADRAKKEFGMTTVPDLLAPRSFELLESTADLKHQTEVAVVPADQEGVKIPIKPKLMCDVINTAKNGATAIVALQELIENSIEAIRLVEPGHPGVIKIDVGHDPAKKTFTLTIHDNGVGINPADMDRVVTFGFSKRGANAAADQEHRDPLALDGFFGKYGIGIKASFVFGEDVQIDLRSKQAGEKVNIS
ncbi:hypothetical protein T484DRAFT_1768938 [Baffinella frigidus]|nr:hypothetical protein T484DRAFT_1768938 [Cryptophyta sp. CCMP2293]